MDHEEVRSDLSGAADGGKGKETIGNAFHRLFV